MKLYLFKIHVMRDNPNHGTSMMGGMWGAKLDAPLRSNFKESISNRNSSEHRIQLHCLLWSVGKLKKNDIHESFSFNHSICNFVF